MILIKVFTGSVLLGVGSFIAAGVSSRSSASVLLPLSMYFFGLAILFLVIHHFMLKPKRPLKVQRKLPQHTVFQPLEEEYQPRRPPPLNRRSY